MRRLEKTGFERQDVAPFGAGAFGKQGHGIAVLQRFGNVDDLALIVAGTAVARHINGLRLRGEVADQRPFGYVVFGDETAGKGGVDGHDV